MVRQLTLFRLHDVDFADANDICHAIILPLSLILGLLAEESFVREGSVDLLSQAARRTLVLGRLLVEFGHFSVELVHFALVDARRCLFERAALAPGFGGARRASSVLLFELLDLLLYIIYSLFENFILEELVAERDSEIRVQSHMIRIRPFHGRLASRFGPVSASRFIGLSSPCSRSRWAGSRPIDLLGRLFASDQTKIRPDIHRQTTFNTL